MYLISELAQKVGLSRSTLLYYEKLGLISSERKANQYRDYSERDFQRIKLLQQLQAGGLTLNECLECLESRINREKLQSRLKVLDDEILQKQKSRDLLASMLGMSSMKEWHQAMDEQAPEAHLDWLEKQGFSEKQSLRLKWLSKDINEHDQYMADFEHVFEGLNRLGVGSVEDTLKALQSIPLRKGTLLEVGCGRGASTLILAKHSQFEITALDNDEYNLCCLKESTEASLIKHKLKTICASMTNMPFDKMQFDVIWSEGSAYIMGVYKALESWKSLLKPGGYMIMSDLVWVSSERSLEAIEFWHENYPNMKTVQQHKNTIEKLGYKIVNTFQSSLKSWNNYLTPLTKKIEMLSTTTVKSKALIDIKKEMIIHQKYLGQYGYQVFVLKIRG